MDETQVTDSTPPLAQPEEPAAERKSRRVAAMVIVASVVLPVAIGGLVWYLLTATSPLEDAQQQCAPLSPYAVIGDDGDTLSIRSVGKESPGLTVDQLACFMVELDVTDAITTEISTTRALDGRQSAEWDGLRASWTYHPDSGLRMIVTTS